MSVVGLMVSSFAGVKYGPLFYRSLENTKTDALQANGWDIEGKVTLSPLCKQHLLWWIAYVDQFPKTVTIQTPHLTLTSDSSLVGWGAVIEGTSSVASSQWSYHESQLHNNYLELKAILLRVQALCSHLENCHIKVLCDNTTTVSYIYSMGGSKSRNCNDLTREIFM